jgi:endonuclease YncB( thermonuclease family)
MVFRKPLRSFGAVSLAGALCLAAARGETGSEACAVPEVAETKIISVTQDGDIALADGQTARLAFLNVPDAFADAARARLAAILGEAVRVQAVDTNRDRWGRIVAQIFPSIRRAEGSTEEGSLGTILVRAGLARVKPEPMARVESLDCVRALLASETAARRAGAGLWADARYAPKDAADTAGLLALAGDFAIFEGRVLSVGERRERTYLNFGKRWSEDTTVSIPNKMWSQMGGHGLTAKTLNNRRVRVRGTVENRDGPLIEVVTPAQIELVDGER